MTEIPDESIDLVVTSPPYFNIKDYSLDGYQLTQKSDRNENQIGDISEYSEYIGQLLMVWKECLRVLKPNGKLIINVPLMPMLKKQLNTHYNRHIFDLNADIQNSIINNTELYLYDTYIWNRTNPSKKLMFGSYPYPRNFYAQNTIEFVTVYVKDGKRNEYIPEDIKERSKLSEKEWVEYTKQVWDIPIPNRNDIAFGSHPAIMPEEIALRCIRLFTFVGDIVLDPFAGSGTTLKAARDLERNYVGYEIMESYSNLIEAKLETDQLICI
ncbi:MAG: site-specific DNA-methyltransferase [Candidatus Cloacimonetes bacterium]|nr:site-specific DNA-methyltransferase [Candidatus Cloacimonadota bacterium]